MSQQSSGNPGQLPTPSKTSAAPINQHLITAAWDGTYFKHKTSELSKINKLFIENLYKKHRISESTFLQGLKPLGSTNLEWIQYVGKVFNEIPIGKILQSPNFHGLQKSDKIAQKFREIGNNHYKNFNFKSALRAYNLAIIFGESNAGDCDAGPELSLAFGNRSALFYQLGEFAKCLQDISYAKQYNYPIQAICKLDERIKKCFKALNLEASDAAIGTLEISELLKTLPVPVLSPGLSGLKEDQIKYGKTELFQLKNPNPQIPTAEDFVEIVSNPDRGRHVVVKQDVKPGTVVIVDQPYAKILLNDWKFDVDHCHYCHKEISCGIPCRECIFAYFCNFNCYTRAMETFHKYECKISHILYLLQAPRTLLLALRIICTLGPEEIYRIYSSRDPQYHPWNSTPEDQTAPASSSTTEILGFDANTQIYDSLSYLPIFHLISHPNQSNRNEIWSYALSSLTIVAGLKEFSTFFEEIQSNTGSDTEFQQFIASSILLHMQNLPCNAHSLNELKNFDEILKCKTDSERENLIKTSICTEYGAGAFGLLSLINHSCDPNVFRVNLYNGKVAVITLRHLKPGQELLDNYGVHFALHELSERRAHLMENYSFNCECIACQFNWPLLPELKNLTETFVCPKCSQNFTENCVLSPSKPICTNCNQKYDYKVLIDSLNCQVDLFFYAHDLLLQNEPVQALPFLKECLEYFDSAICPPFIRLNDTQETMKQALNLIAGSTNYAE